MSKKKGNELIKIVMATALCLGLFGAGYLGINNFVLASATGGTQPRELATATVSIPDANASVTRGTQSHEFTPATVSIKDANASATRGTQSHVLAPPTVSTPDANAPLTVSDEAQYPEIALDVIAASDTTPSRNALSPEAAADLGAQYILDMFGKSIYGRTVHMIYHNHPAFTRATWSGRVIETGEVLDGWAQDDFDWMNLEKSTLFTFSLDAVTGERIDIFNHSHWAEMSEEVRAARGELMNSLNQGISTVEGIAIRSGGEPPAQLDDYIEAAREHAQMHFNTTEVVSINFRNVNALTYDLDDNGNLITTNRQLIFEVTDSTGRVADVAITEATKELIWLITGSNDIVPGYNYVGEEPGLG